MSIKMASFLLKLPVELVYRILDKLDEKTIFLSMRNVCTQLNTIIDTYHRYRVNFSFITKLAFHYLRNSIHLKIKSYSSVPPLIQFDVRSNKKIIHYTSGATRRARKR
jgi:hypothetical protein